MDVHIETDRLLIRPLLAEDDEGMFAMDSDPEVLKYIMTPPTASIEAEREVIRFVQQQYIDNGIGRWAMLHKATGDFIGWMGFKYITITVNGHTNFYDFGYRLARRHWGKGYASEGARAALQYGIEKLGFKEVFAMTHIDNAASRRILEKMGFKLMEIFPYDDNGANTWLRKGMPTTWYQLDTATYKQ